MSNNQYAETLQRFQQTLREAVSFTDPNWTNSATTRERIKRMTAAQGQLRSTLAALPSQATVQDTAPLRRAALDQMRPTNADTVAVTNNEWAKVQKLLNAGHNAEQLIRQADRTRLTAIIDQMPTELAVNSTDPEGVIAEVEQLALERLVELGDEKATKYTQAVAAAGYDAAWRQVIEQAGTGKVSVEAWSDLYRAAPDEYREAMETYEDQSNYSAKLEMLMRIAETNGEVAGAAR